LAFLKILSQFNPIKINIRSDEGEYSPRLSITIQQRTMSMEMDSLIFGFLWFPIVIESKLYYKSMLGHLFN